MGEAGCFYMIIENFRDGDPLCGRGSTDAGLTVWPGESTSPRESDRQASRLVFDASSLSGAFSISGGSRSPFLNSCTPFPRLPIISGRRPGEQRAEEALEVFQALRIAGRTGPAPLDRHGRLHAAAPAFAFARVRRILPSRTGLPYRVSSWAPTHRPVSGAAPVGGFAGRVRSALPISTKRASLRAP